MVIQFFLSFVLVSGFSASQQPWSWDRIVNDLNTTGGKGLAGAAAPLFHIGKMPPDQRLCYPGWALKPDGSQANPATAKPWPHFDGEHCYGPRPWITGKFPPLPVYFTTKLCSDEELRVGYYVYFAKDGYEAFNKSGHEHNWERVVVQWKRRSDGMFYRENMGLSAHGQLRVKSWKKDLMTFNLEDDPEEASVGGNNDHPKVYMGTIKHQMFPDVNKECRKPGCEDTETEYRSGEWRMMPDKDRLIDASPNSTHGSRIASYNYGVADGTPPALFSTLCTVPF